MFLLFSLWREKESGESDVVWAMAVISDSKAAKGCVFGYCWYTVSK